LDKKAIGQVTHYYDKISVVTVKLGKNLSVGDKIKFGEDGPEQTVDSIQLEHEQLSEGKAKDEVGIKVKQKIKDGTKVYKV